MKSPDKYSPIRFIILFLVLFIALYYFNIFLFGITSKGNYYNAFCDNHLNYIRLLRHTLLHSSASIINLFGFTAITNDYELLVAGHGTLRVVYSCLGLGVMSFFTAFIIAYPKKIKSKLLFLIPGLVIIQLLNIIRFVLLAILWDKKQGLIVDHHTIFNLIIYIIIVISIYFWVKHDSNQPISNAKN